MKFPLLWTAAAFCLGVIVGLAGARRSDDVVKRSADASVTKTEIAKADPAPAPLHAPTARSGHAERRAPPDETTKTVATPSAWPPQATDEELKSVLDVEGRDGLPNARMTLRELLKQTESRHRAILDALAKLRSEKSLPDGERVENWPNGRIKSKGAWRNGKKVGRWQEWDQSGRLVSDDGFDDVGKEHGTVRRWSWNDDGKADRDETTYVHGVADGPFVSYHANENKREESFFRDGRRDGEWRKWHDNGQVESMYQYRDDQPVDGVFMAYWPSSQMRERGAYKNGKLEGLWEQWFENGQKSEEQPFVAGELSGVRREWNEQGALRSATDYVAGKIQGLNRYWSDDGKLEGEERFENDEHEGLSTYYSETVAGQKIREATYVHGKTQGTARGWHDENGRPAYVEEYVNGVREGPAVVWRIDGSKESEGKYRAGVQDGDWTFYKLDGATVDHVEHWRDGKQRP